MAEKVRPGQDGFHFRVGDKRDLAALIRRLSDDAAAWDRLQGSMRRPSSIEDSVAQHLTLYRASRVN
jgi:hypothetical protein